MKKVLISQMDTIEEFDIIELIDDKTKEIKGYYLNDTYKAEIEALIDKEENSPKIVDKK